MRARPFSVFGHFSRVHFANFVLTDSRAPAIFHVSGSKNPSSAQTAIARRTRTARHSWQFDDVPKAQSVALPEHPQHCSRNSSAVPLAWKLFKANTKQTIAPASCLKRSHEARCSLSEALKCIHLVVGGRRFQPEHMRSNLDLSGGMISGEANHLHPGVSTASWTMSTCDPGEAAQNHIA
jgi:hypothetical protein